MSDDTFHHGMRGNVPVSYRTWHETGIHTRGFLRAEVMAGGSGSGCTARH
jgi:hypothetical protein